MVLVVDDEPGLRGVLQWELNNRGILVETAENGREGLARMSQRDFDVVITDVTMPEMDGLRFLEEIKRVSPRTEVIVVTGFGAVEMAVHAMQKGAYDFVLKPYDVDLLMGCVKKAVEELGRCHLCGKKRE
jgi:DNA-binding NtrC family response regulator